MEGYSEGYVDAERPEDDQYSYNSPNSAPAAQAVNYDKPTPDTASAQSAHSVQSQLSATSITTNQNSQGTLVGKGRPSFSNDRRLSVGPGAQGAFAGLSSLSGIAGMGPGQGGDSVPVGFDEGVLRGLCEIDGALPLLADRIKQSIASCKQVATFFRYRSEIEEKYARSLTELSRTTTDVYSRADCKAGSFVAAYNSSFKLQEQLAHNRLRFSQRLNEMAEELLSLGREGEKARKAHKENGSRYQLIVQDADSSVDKCKSRLDSAIEELDRVLAAKEGEAYKDVRTSSTLAGPAYGNVPLAGAAQAGGKSKLGKAMKSGGLLFKGKGAGSLQKQEDDCRYKMDQANENFGKAVQESKQLRKEYFSFQLPKILRMMKEVADELDLGTQYHLTRYAWMYESMTVGDGTLLNPLGAPDEGPGLKAIFEAIDNRSDFKSYMQNYAVARGTPKGPRREGLYDEGFQIPLPPHVQRSNDAIASGHGSPQQQPQGSIPQGGISYTQQSATSNPSHYTNPIVTSTNSALPQIPTDQTSLVSPTSLSSQSQAQAQGAPPQSSPQPQQSQLQPQPQSQLYHVPGIPASTNQTFGVDLGAQLVRDGTAIPKLVEKCAQAIEAYGLESTGVYRLSGTTSRVQALKAALDKDVDNVDVMSDEWSSDINVVCGVLKLWFRELPEPLLTFGLYNGFIDAARYENDRLRHIRLHEQVNELPDPNYATLKYFMGHLDRIRQKESINQMSVSNLSIVFGPTLLGAPPEEGGLNLEHMSFQCKAIETILDKYHEIFVEEE